MGRFALVGLVALAAIGCSGNDKSPEIPGKFVASTPPPGYVEERMKKREGGNRPPANIPSKK